MSGRFDKKRKTEREHREQPPAESTKALVWRPRRDTYTCFTSCCSPANTILTISDWSINHRNKDEDWATSMSLTGGSKSWCPWRCRREVTDEMNWEERKVDFHLILCFLLVVRYACINVCPPLSSLSSSHHLIRGPFEDYESCKCCLMLVSVVRSSHLHLFSGKCEKRTERTERTAVTWCQEKVMQREMRWSYYIKGNRRSALIQVQDRRSGPLIY